MPTKTSNVIIAAACLLLALAAPALAADAEAIREAHRAAAEAYLNSYDSGTMLSGELVHNGSVGTFDALFWSPEYEYSSHDVADLIHGKTRLKDWLETVPEPPALEPQE